MNWILRIKLVVLISVLLCSKTFAQYINDSSTNDLGFDTRKIEFSYIINDSIGNDTRMHPSWYWAACVQMIYSAKGLDYDRIYFINRIKGAPDVNQPSIGIETLQSLKGWTDNSNGRIFLIPTKKEIDTVIQVKSLLLVKWPLGNNLGENEHASRINIFYYKKDDKLGDNLTISPDKVVIRILWSQNSSKYEFSLIDTDSRLKSFVKVWVM